MKRIAGLVLSLSCTVCTADSSLNLAIPSAPGSYQSDRFRAGELDCSMAIGSGVNVEFGTVGVITQNETPITTSAIPPQAKSVGVYGRIIIPIGAPKGRVDCNILYQLELTKKRLEVEKLELELRNLRNLKFENTK